MVMLFVVLILFGYYYFVLFMCVYYGEECKVKYVILGGIVIVLSFYVFWLFSIFGNLFCVDFVFVI